jgi:hypothetical protein
MGSLRLVGCVFRRRGGDWRGKVGRRILGVLGFPQKVPCASHVSGLLPIGVPRV